MERTFNEETYCFYSNLRYSWLACIILSNFCNFSQLVLSTHPLLIYQVLSSYKNFAVKNLTNFCHFLTLCYLLTFYVIYAPYKCTCCTHHRHNSLSCLIVRTLSAPIYLSNSPGVFGHRAILIWGDRDMAGGFLLEQLELNDTLYFHILEVKCMGGYF